MVLLWIAGLIVVWCVVSAATALVLGTYLRRRRAATDPQGALRPLAVGALDLWVGAPALADVPDTPEGLDVAPGTTVPAPRGVTDRVVRDRETVQ